MNLIRQFVFSNRLLAALFASGKQLVDILTCLTKCLVVLLGKPFAKVVRQ
ncbi:hypothetical protein C497_01530 [Halalkalicoccus jeotgali B3]|uniref:Uncharacterized protein n=1 Tax=Halalkalicoccus jeotgali (strain DSM 18796 / CECT 7217 / JCM 14584 / KCTC 4019 / B3) TaxID=795797 RepID=D8JB51_HALJB|nr:hypothetical protein HacjB3_15721 [Halalkalicoccus jeotgali B3]ELY41400.1 hypothetical protein C497_01530 [Halalkalicoccus jeotgali B3]